ncbi:hypothetical protein L914_02133 [Phytophthora nicotianae]|uniref:Uncharacterized protein n=1 Tax=Phytophthora nicotianae TaxID=4792 RepID=W2P0M8_PHYNI|nr:hypothetical protein L914_02133 [Phytophthora nicotianae]
MSWASGFRLPRARPHVDALSTSRYIGPSKNTRIQHQYDRFLGEQRITRRSLSNALRAAPSATSRSDISSALRALRGFAQEFYVDDVTDLIDSALTFIERYRGIADSDTVGWKLVSFWITKKVGKFRSCVAARDLESAQEVHHEFSPMDENSLELLDLRRSHNNGPAALSRSQKQSDGGRRSERQRR